MRLSWNEYFMEITQLVAKRSGCCRRHVGAIIVKDNRILATGYNSSPVGVDECVNRGVCLRENAITGTNLGNCYAVHAEMNAILQCAKLGISTEGSTLYVTTYPCIHCMKSIINSGIIKIVYLNEYNDELSRQLASESGIITEKYDNGSTE